MKINRLLGIVILLSKKEKVTAPELAERFEVSRRTINRDIETLCMAGVPIITKQGGNGGIYIQEGYKLDKNVFTRDELSNVISGLSALDSVNESSNIKRLLEKVTPDNDAVFQSSDSIIIDLASFYKPSISSKIDLLKQAIKESKHVEFTYYSKKGENKRIIEPYIITFRWESWYIYGYCIEACDFRTFKLNRLWELNMLDTYFDKKEVKYTEIDFNEHLNDIHKFEAVFDGSVKYMIIDAYGQDSFTEIEDGSLHFKGSYTNYSHILEWILGFGDKVKVIRPHFLIKDIINNAKNVLKKYN